jgi:hypothetical protein
MKFLVSIFVFSFSIASLADIGDVYGGLVNMHGYTKIHFDSKGQPNFEEAFWKKTGTGDDYKIESLGGQFTIESKSGSTSGVKHLGTYNIHSKEISADRIAIQNNASLVTTDHGKPVSYTYVSLNGVHTVTPALCRHLAKRSHAKNLQELQSKANACAALGDAVKTDSKNSDEVKKELAKSQSQNIDVMKRMSGKKFVEKATANGTNDNLFYANNPEGQNLTVALKNAADACVRIFPDALDSTETSTTSSSSGRR